MSFLADLQNRSKKLRKVDTKVTYLDGKQVVYDSSGVAMVTQKKYGFVVDTKPDFIPSLIRPLLYCGSQDSAVPEMLEKYNIQEVISVGVEPLSKREEVVYHFFEVLDLPETNLARIILACNLIIKNCVNTNRNVLVHCNAGVSRSVSICLGFLILEDNLLFEKALERVKETRPRSQPNAGFIVQLKSLK